MSKPKLQARMTALTFSEKIQILEKLRDREKTIAAAGLRQNVGLGEGDRIMVHPHSYHGKGTVITISEDGTTFANLPVLDKFEKMPDTAEVAGLDCLDSDGPIKTPIGVLGGDLVAEGPYESTNAGLMVARDCYQALRPIYYKATAVNGSDLLSGSCWVVKFDIKTETGLPRFTLRLKNI